MKRFKQGLVLAMSALTILTAGCGDGNTGKVANPNGTVGFSSHADDGERGIPMEIQKNIESSVKSAGGTFDVVYANGNANVQLDQVNALIDQNPAALILLAVNGDSIVPAVTRANEKGIPVFATNRDVRGGKFTNVINDERMAGEIQGRYMAERLPQNAKVVYLTGDMTISPAQLRWQGFKEALLDKRPDVTLLAKTATTDWSFASGVRNMMTWLKLYPQIDGVAAANDNLAIGAAKAMQEAGRLQPTTIICGVDATKEAFEAIEKGTMSLTVQQDTKKNSRNHL